jgi:hypothetical protein
MIWPLFSKFGIAFLSPRLHGSGTLIARFARAHFADHTDMATRAAGFKAFIDGLFDIAERDNILRIDSFYRSAGGLMKQL